MPAHSTRSGSCHVAESGPALLAWARAVTEPPKDAVPDPPLPRRFDSPVTVAVAVLEPAVAPVLVADALAAPKAGPFKLNAPFPEPPSAVAVEATLPLAVKLRNISGTGGSHLVRLTAATVASSGGNCTIEIRLAVLRQYQKRRRVTARPTATGGNITTIGAGSILSQVERSGCRSAHRIGYVYRPAPRTLVPLPPAPPVAVTATLTVPPPVDVPVAVPRIRRYRRHRLRPLPEPPTYQ